MKILGICCSPRPGQSTFQAMQTCLAAAGEQGEDIETDLLELAGRDLRPCLACGECKTQLACPIDDDFGSLIPTLADPEVAGMIVGTPVYFGMMTAQCKTLIDRCVMFRRNDWIFRNRVGGVLAVGGVRNGGQELTIQAVQAAMMCHDMICVSDGQPTAHFGATLFSGGGGVQTDDFGLATARHLGRRVAEVARRMRGGAEKGG
ncbi:MAG: flavodoxin family protein [Phycisphaerales bacterium]|nr:flavodoxin family protein [Phycisphaerales bacterium]